MPVELVKRINLDQLYLPFVHRLLDLLDRCQKRGAEYHAISGFRTYAEQDELYHQGRGMPGPIVTQAAGGQSTHNFGIAVDLCRDGYVDRRGLQPDWRRDSYDILGEEAAAVGLLWGGTWRPADCPHVQLPGYVTEAQIKPLRLAFGKEGIAAAWALIPTPKEP